MKGWRAMNLKFLREVSCDSEYFGDEQPPTHAIIEITPELLRWIGKARRALKSLEAPQVTMFDYTPQLKVSEEDLVMNPGQELDLSGLKDADDFRCDYMILHVSADNIHWEICEKHSSVLFSTNGIFRDEFKENLKVLRTKPTLLPLLVGHLENESAIHLLNERLKGTT